MRKHSIGLTLIEVLIIVVMVGILLTITIQKIRGRGPKDVRVTLKADVENARDAEGRYFAAHNAYGTQAQLDSAKLLNTTDGNTVSITMTATGYVATSTNLADPANPRNCKLEVAGGESEAAKAQAVCN
jgi:Tfp pilus assembly protein PilE